VLAILFVILALGTARRRDEPFYAALAAVAALGLAFAALTGRLDASSWNVDLIDMIITSGVVLLGAQLWGLPLPIARRLGIGLRSREWEFDRKLYPIVAEFRELLLDYPGPTPISANQAWAAKVVANGDRLLVRLRSLTPPDANWDGLRNDYVALYEAILAGLLMETAEDQEALKVRSREIERRHGELRREYRARAEAILGRSPSVDSAASGVQALARRNHPGDHTGDDRQP